MVPIKIAATLLLCCVAQNLYAAPTAALPLAPGVNPMATP